MIKKVTRNGWISRFSAIALILAALFILIPSCFKTINFEAISLKSNTAPQVAVNQNFGDPTGILNLIAMKKYDEAEREFQYFKSKYKDVPVFIIQYLHTFFQFEDFIKFNPYDEAEFLIKEYKNLEKYLLKNKKSAADVFTLVSIIPFDVIMRIYDEQNSELKKTSVPLICSNFRKITRAYENSIILDAHNSKMTLQDARILCMRENFCFLRANQRSFGNKNTRISERKEIASDIIRLKSEWREFLSEDGKYKDVARYLEKLQFESETRNMKGFNELSRIPDFSAIP